MLFYFVVKKDEAKRMRLQKRQSCRNLSSLRNLDLPGKVIYQKQNRNESRLPFEESRYLTKRLGNGTLRFKFPRQTPDVSADNSVFR